MHVYELKDHKSCSVVGCARMARRIISCTNVGSIFPYGKRFEHVDDGVKEFTSYRDLDRHLEKQGLSAQVLTASEIRKKQEDRRNRQVRKEGKKIKLSSQVDRAFRESPSVDTAVRALKEGRV